MQKPAHKQIHSHAADAPPLQTAVCWRQWLRRHACLYGALALVCVRVRARRSSRAIARVAPACLNVLVLCTISAVYGCDGPEQDVALKDQGLVVQEIEQRPVLHQLHDELRTRMTGHTRTNVSGRATGGRSYKRWVVDRWWTGPISYFGTRGRCDTGGQTGGPSKTAGCCISRCALVLFVQEQVQPLLLIPRIISITITLSIPQATWAGTGIPHLWLRRLTVANDGTHHRRDARVPEPVQ